MGRKTVWEESLGGRRGPGEVDLRSRRGLLGFGAAFTWTMVLLFLLLGQGLEGAKGVDLVPRGQRMVGPRVHWMMLRGGGGGVKGDAGTDVDKEGDEMGSLLEEAMADANGEDPEVAQHERGRGVWFAAEEGDEAEIEEWVTCGADVNATAHSQLNAGAPLHWAAMRGQLGAINKLLNLGADVNGRSKKDNQTALHWAASKGMSEACMLLHSRGAHVNAADSCGWTPLHSAACDEPPRTMLLAAATRRVRGGLGSTVGPHPNFRWAETNDFTLSTLLVPCSQHAVFFFWGGCAVSVPLQSPRAHSRFPP